MPELADVRYSIRDEADDSISLEEMFPDLHAGSAIRGIPLRPSFGVSGRKLFLTNPAPDIFICLFKQIHDEDIFQIYLRLYFRRHRKNQALVILIRNLPAPFQTDPSCGYEHKCAVSLRSG